MNLCGSGSEKHGVQEGKINTKKSLKQQQQQQSSILCFHAWKNERASNIKFITIFVKI